MTNETKQLFDAPWGVEGFGTVVCVDGSEVASGCTSGDAARIARMPELYDALFEITIERCAKCVATHANRGIQAPLGFDFFTGECPFETDKYYDGDPCVWRQRWKLLGKVRDGK